MLSAQAQLSREIKIPTQKDARRRVCFCSAPLKRRNLRHSRNNCTRTFVVDHEGNDGNDGNVRAAKPQSGEAVTARDARACVSYRLRFTLLFHWLWAEKANTGAIDN